MYTSVCKYCKKIFKTPFFTVCCSECRGKQGDAFEDIKAYLKEFPNSNAMQIAEALEIPVTDVIAFINEGYLIQVKGKFERL